ncbi:hypothetical protein NFJ02_03g105280 [Pycnococcus provasolii]
MDEDNNNNNVDLPAWNSAFELNYSQADDQTQTATTATTATTAAATTTPRKDHATTPKSASKLARTPSGRIHSLGPARRVKTPVRRVVAFDDTATDDGAVQQTAVGVAIPESLKEKQRTDFEAFIKMMASVLVKCMNEKKDEMDEDVPLQMSSPPTSTPAAESAQQPRTPGGGRLLHTPGGSLLRSHGPARRVKTPVRRAVFADDDHNDAEGGSVTALAVVRSSAKETAVTPVRRSARSGVSRALQDANSLLEKTGYSYTPNKALAFDKDVAAQSAEDNVNDGDDGDMVQPSNEKSSAAAPVQPPQPQQQPRRSARLRSTAPNQ